MVILPLNKKLKKKLHKTMALAEDILIMEMYNNFPTVVIHGGTALWRCFSSNRFSEDIDVYLPLAVKKINFKKFLDGLKAKGFAIEKFKKTNNSIFSKFSYLGAIVRFEAIFENVKNPITKNFEMSDGSYILVNTLLPESLFEEKILTYTKRRKVRDLYDIFFLLKIVRKDKVKNTIIRLIKEFEKPIDEKELKALIISGSIPSAEEMLKMVKIWAR